MAKRYSLNIALVDMCRYELLRFSPAAYRLAIFEAEKFATASNIALGTKRQKDGRSTSQHTDTVTGFVGEIAASVQSHRKYGLAPLGPDTRIFKQRDKSWEPDFPHAKTRIHAKTSSYVSVSHRYTPSVGVERKPPYLQHTWLTQNDPENGRIDPVLTEAGGHDFFVLAGIVDKQLESVIFKGVFSQPVIVHASGPPREPGRMGRKTGIYEDLLPGYDPIWSSIKILDRGDFYVISEAEVVQVFAGRESFNANLAL